MDRVATIAREGLKKDIPMFAAGDTLRVMVRVRERRDELLVAEGASAVLGGTRARTRDAHRVRKAAVTAGHVLDLHHVLPVVAVVVPVLPKAPVV